jgi:uncharacterized Fe-S center protein
VSEPIKALSKVYFIPARREDGDEVLARKAEKIFLNLGLKEQMDKKSFVALKIHFGEEGNTGFIKPRWLGKVINQIKSVTPRVFLTDSNTLYLGRRSNSIDHLKLARDHGFTEEALGVPVIIADGLIGRNDDELQVDFPLVKKAKIASAILDSDLLICLSHFTGHVQAGIGGSIKNLGMGCASRAGKLEQHSDVKPWINPKNCTGCRVCLDHCPAQAISLEDEKAIIEDEKCIGCGECLVVCKQGAIKIRWDSDYRLVQKKMSEYASSVLKHFKGKIGFINFLLKVTKDCDCMSQDAPAVVEDIGILGSLDPVAADKASVDLIIKRSGKDVFKAGYDIDWSIQLKHGNEVGLGNLDYELIEEGISNSVPRRSFGK